MATTKVSSLAALTSPDGAEELLINDGGTSKKITQANLLLGIDNTSADATAITINSSENVGIGTTSPAALLDLTVGQAKTVTSGAKFIILGKTNEASNYSALNCEVKGGASQADRKWEFQTVEQGVANAGSIVFQKDGGNVGIGTASPSSALHVAGTINTAPSVAGIHMGMSGSHALISLNAVSGNAAYIDFTNNVNEDCDYRIMETQDGSYIAMSAGTTTSNGIAVASSGNVGIGTTSPSHTLDVAGGIVEQGGVLKENLLTNSGFDVWSNSTLENVGSDLITNGGFDADSDWTKETGWTIGSGVASTTATTTHAIYQVVSTFEIGKLYKIQYTVSGYSLGGARAYIDGGGGRPMNEANGTFNTVFEATATSHTIGVGCKTSTANAFDIDNVSLYEVTPGCVAADSLAMDTWGKNNPCDIYREQWDGVVGHFGTGYNVQSGSQYSLKIVGGTNGTWDVYFGNGNFYNQYQKERFSGRTVTFGAWVKTDAANQVQLQFFDDGANLSSNNTGTDWEWLEITKTVDANAAQTSVGFLVDNTKTAYISQPMLVFGSSIGEGNYTRPQGEWIECEQEISLTNYQNTTYSDGAAVIYLEQESQGKIPKGCKAIRAKALSRDSDSSGSNCSVTYYPQSSPLVSNIASNFGSLGHALGDNNIDYTMGTCACDVSGNIYRSYEASGSDTLDVWLSPHAIQLR